MGSRAWVKNVLCSRRVAHVMLTVDVETDAGSPSLRGVDEAMPVMLDVLDAVGARAVFFVVGDVALARPELVKELSRRGHVVGSHSMTHPAFSKVGGNVVRDELTRSKQTLEALISKPCVGFRAPYFDAPRDLGIHLAHAGYKWSSSKAPFSLVAKYRDLFSSRSAHRLLGSDVLELPVPGMMGLPIPEGLPWRRLFSPLAALAKSPPSVFYWHPYDLLDDSPVDGFSKLTRTLMQFRSGRWSREYLLELLRAWKAKGAVLAPPPEVV
ncbi:MAG: polysaccharide deacetylase family protein [Archangium sp.]